MFIAVEIQQHGVVSIQFGEPLVGILFELCQVERRQIFA